MQGLAHHFLGIGLSSKLEKFAEAMGHFQSAVEAFQYLGDAKEEAAVSFSKAWTMRSFGDFDEALALVTQALSMDSCFSNHEPRFQSRLGSDERPA